MAIHPSLSAHSAFGALAGAGRLSFVELAEGGETYAAAAIGEHPDCLELHIHVLRFGPGAVRALKKDLEELKTRARALGKGRIVGLRVEDGGTPDPRWPKFTRLFGFTNQRLMQVAELPLD